jgi:ribose-phosphate pyrophosphokinase
MFPDKCSQVWKLPDEVYSKIRNSYYNEIRWQFENEAELINVCQLRLLIGSIEEKRGELFIPYLPYARQDKEVSNNTTFGLQAFSNIINSFNFNKVSSVDVHSNNHGIKRFVNVLPNEIIKHTFIKTDADIIVYPDKGASLRYYLPNHTKVYFEKTRDQLTGNIIGMDLLSKEDLTNKRCLIVDDLCDGGGTFKLVAEQLLNKHKVSNVDLYVSHGLFTKGIQTLRDSGINRIFTYKGEIND